MDCPGRGLRDVFYLCSLEDSRNLRASAATAKAAVVIGGGFIGMEVAAVLQEEHSDHNDYPGGPSVESILHPGDVNVVRALLPYPRRAACKASRYRGLGREWSIPCRWSMDAGSQAIWLL